MSFVAPHVPVFSSPRFRGVSPRGAYGDAVVETDDVIGRIQGVIADLGLQTNLLSIVTSDNGPWTLEGSKGGSAGPFRGGKGGTYEGGQRVPAIF